MTEEAVARVLLVEDDVPLARIVAGHLKARGHEARVVPSVELAKRELAEGYRPTVVLLDINLPDDSGWALLRSGSLERAGSPPVYVVSATAVPSSRLHEFDVAGFLPKPFAMPTLLELVERRAGGGARRTEEVGEALDAR